MKKLLNVAVLCMAISTQSFAQDEVWYFGAWNTNPPTAAGIQFSGGSLLNRNNEAAATFYEASTIVSDGSGNVLFYSDGLKIWDKNHAVMTNGSGLIGSNEPGNTTGSGVQGVLAINDPGNASRYYVFTGPSVEQTTSNTGLHYNIVDLSVGATGTVTSKNQVLINSATTRVAEAMAAISKSCDTTWVVVHGATNNNFYAFEITAAGINTTPVVSSVGPVINGTQFAQGSIDFTPHGDRLAYTSAVGLYLFDFNIKTGVVSNSTPVATTTAYWGTEFSPDGSKLYYTQYMLGELRQYDLCTTTITLLDATSSNLGELATGKDGKIYGVFNGNNAFNGRNLLCINSPNSAGAAANVVLNAYNTGMDLGPGLPQMYFSPGFISGNVQAQITRTIPDTICESYTSVCMDLSATPSVAGVWRSVPTGFVNSHGVFNAAANVQDTTVVKVFFGMPGCVLEDSTTIVVINCCKKINTNAPSNSICPGDSLDLSTLVVDGVGTWSIFQKPAGSQSATYAAPWFKTKLSSDPGTYRVTFKLTSQINGCKDTTIENVVVKTPPAGPASLSATFCSGDSVTLNAGDLNHTYSWSPGGSTGNTLKVGSAGAYIVTKVSNATTCTAIDTINVSSLALPSGSIADTSVCAGGSISLNAGNWQSYRWDNASTQQSTNISSTGQHWVIVEGNNACKDTIFFDVNPGDTITVTLNNPGVICSGASATLNATVSGVYANPLSYSWDGTAGIASQTFSSGTSHNVTVTDGRNCKGSKTATFTLGASPYVTLGNDTTRCFKENQTYTAAIVDTFTTVTWMDASTNSSITIATAQIISVTVTNSDGCADTDSVSIGNYCEPAEPCFGNVVTPNNDGFNDNFQNCDSTTIEKFEEISIVIYDRWGLKMFESTDVMPVWDCKFNGNPVAPGVYYWVCRWKNTAEIEGEKTGWIQVMLQQ
ncbi:MAG: gliding motility-associated C-terminal domain-containing protein [Flavobacteriales bacterium]